MSVYQTKITSFFQKIQQPQKVINQEAGKYSGVQQIVDSRQGDLIAQRMRQVLLAKKRGLKVQEKNTAVQHKLSPIQSQCEAIQKSPLQFSHSFEPSIRQLVSTVEKQQPKEVSTEHLVSQQLSALPESSVQVRLPIGLAALEILQNSEGCVNKVRSAQNEKDIECKHVGGSKEDRSRGKPGSKQKGRKQWTLEQQILNNRLSKHSQMRYQGQIEYSFVMQINGTNNKLWVGSQDIMKLNPQWLQLFFSQFI